MALNVYKTSNLVDAYSKDGAYTDPIFPSSSVRFDGVSGQTRDVKLFIRNDGAQTVIAITVTPKDSAVGGEEIWLKLANTLAGLDGAVGGAALDIPDLVIGATHTFWSRCAVPASTPNGLKQNLALRVQAQVVT